MAINPPVTKASNTCSSVIGGMASAFQRKGSSWGAVGKIIPHGVWGESFIDDAK